MATLDKDLLYDSEDDAEPQRLLRTAVREKTPPKVASPSLWDDGLYGASPDHDPTVPHSPVFDSDSEEAAASGDESSQSSDSFAFSPPTLSPLQPQPPAAAPIIPPSPTSEPYQRTSHGLRVAAQPRAVRDRTTSTRVANDAWRVFETAMSEMTLAAPPPSSATEAQFSPRREEPTAPTPPVASTLSLVKPQRPMSLFKQKAILERGAELEKHDDTNIDELARSNASVARQIAADRVVIDELTLHRLASLQRPKNADVPRGEFAPHAQLRALQFDTLTEREIRAMASMTVTSTYHLRTLADGTVVPHDDGLLSERMGPIERKHSCPVCQGAQSTPGYLAPSSNQYMCDGHYGVIELSGALFNPELVDVLVSALRCWCWDCGQLPGTDAHNRAVIRSLIKPDINGRHKTRAERLSMLNAAYAKRLTCEQCFKDPRARELARCRKCAVYVAQRQRTETEMRAAGAAVGDPVDADGQCPQCEAPTAYRAQVRKLHKPAAFDSFPYLVYFELPQRVGLAGVRRTGVMGADGVEVAEVESKSERDQARLENYFDRHNITRTEMELTPERARKIIEGIGNDAALLLSGATNVWHVVETGGIDVARYTQQQLGDAKLAAVEWLESMASAYVFASPHPTRQSDTASGLKRMRLNELTSGLRDVLVADNKLRETQLASSVAQGAARVAGVGNRIMRFKDDEKWHSQSHSDCVYNQVAEMYGRVQYYWAMLVRATHAPFWLPTGNRSIKVPDKARKGAERTKNKGRGFMSDLGGKDGFMRLMLQGSRCDFSFRSVIVCDPRLDIDEIGICREFAQRLSVPVQLAAFNFVQILKEAEALRVNAGRGALAAKMMLFDEHHTETVSYTELPNTVYESPLARIGSWIEMPIRNGTTVVMNRQPSLHRPSMMGHRVRILPDDFDPLITTHDQRRMQDKPYQNVSLADPPFRRSTRTGPAIRINGNVVEPYNADFDGDEMTGHVPQSLAARIEAEQLMAVGQNIINVKTGSTQIKLRQNHLLGLHLMTVQEQFVDSATMMSLLTEALPTGSFPKKLPKPAIMHPRQLWTMRQIISMLLPENLTLVRGELDPHRFASVEDASKTPPPALIVRGQMLYGVFNAQLSSAVILGMYTSASNTNMVGEDVRGTVPDACVTVTKQYLKSAALLVEAWFEGHGASIGVENMMTDVPLRTVVREKCADCINDASHREATRSCPWCRLQCRGCAAVRARYQRSGRKFTFVDDACGQCAASTAVALCHIHLCKTILPRCENCHELSMARPHFSLGSVPREITNSEEWPHDVALWLRVGPIKFDIWARLRADDVKFATVVKTWQTQLQRATPSVQQINALESQLVRVFAAKIATLGDDSVLMLPSNAEAHLRARDHWQKVGPTKYRIERRLARVEGDVQAVIRKKRHAFRVEHDKGHYTSVDTRIDDIEAAIIKTTKAAREETHQWAWNAVERDSCLRQVIEAGTKGTVLNVGNCVACVGDQQLDGARIVDRIVGQEGGEESTTRLLANLDHRYLPHYTKRYPGAAEGGFGAQSLMDGASPVQFWNMAVAGRESIVNTAVKTAPVGYLTRRVGKIVEDKLVASDGTVRDSSGAIVQQRYGAGYNTQFMTTKKLPPLTMSDAQLAQCVLIDADTDDCVRCSLTGEVDDHRRALVLEERKQVAECLAYLREVNAAANSDSLDTVRTVNNVPQLLLEATYSGDGAFHSTAQAALLAFDTSASPVWHNNGAGDDAMARWRADINARQRAESRVPYDESLALLDECECILLTTVWLTEKAACTHAHCATEHNHLDHVDDLTRAELRLRLCAKQVVRRLCMNRRTLESFMEAYQGWLRRATVVAGDAVGTIADQSFASENMQATLSSFHKSGESSVVVNQGMPRSLETLAARSTAKMATPKVTAHLPAGGAYRTDQLDALLRETLGELVKMEVVHAYDAAWQQLGRWQHRRQLDALLHRAPDTALPLAPSTGARKRASAARERAYEDELHEAKESRQSELGALLDAALDICTVAKQRHYTATLGSLLEGWKTVTNVDDDRGGRCAVLRATVRADCHLLRCSAGYARLLCTAAMWHAIAPLLGKHRAFRVRTLYDTNDERWLGVEFIFLLPPDASVQDRAEATAFYAMVRDESDTIYVFTPDVDATETIEALREEEFAHLLAQLAAPRNAWETYAADKGAKETADDVKTARQLNVDGAMVFPHQTQLRQPTLSELLDQLEIIYAPLEPGDEHNEHRPRLAPAAPGTPACFDAEIVDAYASYFADNDFGCRVCREGGDARYGTVAGTTSATRQRGGASTVVNGRAHCSPDVRCLSPFVLQATVSRQAMVNSKSIYANTLWRLLSESLGADHSVLTTDFNSERPVIHVRLHTCGLDRLARRTEAGADTDFARPLLDETLPDAVINVADDQTLDEVAPRARRGKSAKQQRDAASNDPQLERYLRLHMQNMLRGNVKHRVPRMRANMRLDTGVADYCYSAAQCEVLWRTVEHRVAAKEAANIVVTTIGDEQFLDAGVIKRLRAKCGELPTNPGYIETDQALIVRREPDLFGIVEQQRSSSDIVVTYHTLAELIEQERQQIATQLEVAELQRTMGLVCGMHIGGVDTESRTICIERVVQLRTSTSGGGGTVRREVRGVALDSRNYLRVMNERLVDRRTTTTNAIMDVLQVLGTVAAREKTYAELHAVVAATGAFVDRAHLALLAGVQWCHGLCMPFTVHGLKGVSNDVLQQMSFETTATMLRDAVVRRANNALVSPSACISLGVPVWRLGTNACDVLLHVNTRFPVDTTMPLDGEALASRRVFESEIAAHTASHSKGKERLNPLKRFPRLSRAMFGAFDEDDEEVPDSPTDNFGDDHELADFVPPVAKPTRNDPPYDPLNPTYAGAPAFYDPTARAGMPAYDPTATVMGAGMSSMYGATTQAAHDNVAEELAFLGGM